MQVQVWRVAACQFVSGKPALFNSGLKLCLMKFEAWMGFPTLLVNTSPFVL